VLNLISNRKIKIGDLKMNEEEITIRPVLYEMKEEGYHLRLEVSNPWLTTMIHYTNSCDFGIHHLTLDKLIELKDNLDLAIQAEINILNDKNDADIQAQIDADNARDKAQEEAIFMEVD
jgi:trehalose/maltose hydrolase-like predicted phosphorylase